MTALIAPRTTLGCGPSNCYYTVHSHFYIYKWSYYFGLLFGIGPYACYLADAVGFRTDYDDLLCATRMLNARELASRFGIDVSDLTSASGGEASTSSGHGSMILSPSRRTLEACPQTPRVVANVEAATRTGPALETSDPAVQSTWSAATRPLTSAP